MATNFVGKIDLQSLCRSRDIRSNIAPIENRLIFGEVMGKRLDFSLVF